MLLEHREKVYEYPLSGTANNKESVSSGHEPLGRLKVKWNTGSGQKPDIPSMCQRYEEADDGTWRERQRVSNMLADGSVFILMKGLKKMNRPYKSIAVR